MNYPGFPEFAATSASHSHGIGGYLNRPILTRVVTHTFLLAVFFADGSA
jgi:hypothetical protein